MVNWFWSDLGVITTRETAGSVAQIKISGGSGEVYFNRYRHDCREIVRFGLKNKLLEKNSEIRGNWVTKIEALKLANIVAVGGGRKTIRLEKRSTRLAVSLALLFVDGKFGAGDQNQTHHPWLLIQRKTMGLKATLKRLKGRRSPILTQEFQDSKSEHDWMGCLEMFVSSVLLSILH